MSIIEKTIRVCLVEDHSEIRQGMSYIINSTTGYTCIAYPSAESALKDLNPDEVDVVLMDINLPGMNGIECTSRIKREHPHIAIMMCTAYEDDDNIFKALTAGAKGYILKRAAGDSLIEAIRDLYNGGSPMSSIIARKVVESFQQKTAVPPIALTSRENEILDLLARGFTNKEIASQLNVSVNTIRTHVYNIYEKLHVQNKVEALNKSGRKLYFL